MKYVIITFSINLTWAGKWTHVKELFNKQTKDFSTYLSGAQKIRNGIGNCLIF